MPKHVSRETFFILSFQQLITQFHLSENPILTKPSDFHHFSVGFPTGFDINFAQGDEAFLEFPGL